MFIGIGLPRHPSVAARRVATDRPSLAAPASVAPPPPAPPETGSACGWFDSSWELRQGLRVIEHMDFDRLPAEVPLAWLLQ